MMVARTSFPFVLTTSKEKGLKTHEFGDKCVKCKETLKNGANFGCTDPAKPFCVDDHVEIKDGSYRNKYPSYM